MASPGILVRLWGRAQSSPVLALLSTAVVLFMGLVVAWGAARNASRRKMRELHGCRPARRVVTSKYFGLAFIYGMVQGIRNHRFLEQLVEQFEANGHTHAVRILGGESTWTIEPDNIRQVLAVNFKDYSIKEREPVLRPLLGRGIFVTDGEDWARSRALLRPNFAKDQVADLSMIERHIQLFLQRIPNTAEMIDLHELIQAFTMDSSTEFLFGESTNTLAGDLNRDFSDSFTLTLDEISIDLRMGWLSMFRRKDPRAAGANRLCRDHTTKYVNQALAYRKRVLAADTDGDASNHDNRRTFLREIALATDDRERICDELLSILMAGRDTMASLLGSMLFVLARKPDVWAKVRAEVQQAFGDDLPTYQQLRDLKYAKYCINESTCPSPGFEIPRCLMMLTTDASPEAVSSGPDEHQDGRKRHRLADWRRPRRQRPHPRPERQRRHLSRLRHAQATRHLRRRRRRVPPRTVGGPEVDLG